VIALLQRVRHAWVEVDAQRIAEIGTGLLVLVGVERGDSPEIADRLLRRLLDYRVFADAQGRMNLSRGELLLVPQFTLAADTGKGRRPGFTAAASPDDSRRLFDYFCAQAQRQTRVQLGRFGAEMQVGLVNDGPVTFWLQVPPRR
jgi:D-tyrosyl-tRNA(Tyr) deacylase